MYNKKHLFIAIATILLLGCGSEKTDHRNTTLNSNDTSANLSENEQMISCSDLSDPECGDEAASPAVSAAEHYDFGACLAQTQVKLGGSASSMGLNNCGDLSTRSCYSRGYECGYGNSAMLEWQDWCDGLMGGFAGPVGTMCAVMSQGATVMTIANGETGEILVSGAVTVLNELPVRPTWEEICDAFGECSK